MDSLTITIAWIFATLLIFYYLSKKSKPGKGKTPPKPSGSWPIIGHLPLLGGPSPHETLGAIADEYGPIFTLKLGVHPTLVVSSPEIAKELFTTNDLAGSSRPLTVAIKILSYDAAMFGFAPYSAYWRDMRRLVTLELLSNRRLELLKHVRISEVENSIKQLYKFWVQEEKGSGRALVELKKWFVDTNLNVIIRMIAGKKYYDISAEANKEEAERFQNALRNLFKYLGMFVARDAVPALGWLDLGGHEKGMKTTAKEIDSVIGQWLEEHKRNRRVDKAQDFMDVLLSVLDGKEFWGFDADTICKATCLSMISGGTDTSFVAMTWAVALLLNNRHVLRKAQEELDACVGRERLVKDTDIVNLVYLQAIVKETLRLYPPGPLSAPRQFIEGCTIAGYDIPKDTWLMVNLWKIQTDGHIWTDPFEFKPERFLTTHKDVDVKGHHFELIPFGSGRRVCPGISFALKTVHLTLATLLQAFEISTPGDDTVDMTGSPGLTNLKATPLDVLVSPRLPPHLYA